MHLDVMDSCMCDFVIADKSKLNIFKDPVLVGITTHVLHTRASHIIIYLW